MPRRVTIFGTRVPLDQITQVTYNRDGVQVTLSGDATKPPSPKIMGFARPARPRLSEIQKHPTEPLPFPGG